jgi:zinc protease
VRSTVRCSAWLVVAALWTGTALAQTSSAAQAQTLTPTADDVIEKHLAALGGRAALAKIESRTSTGSIAVSEQGIEVAGSIEVYAKAPNKARSYTRLDLSQVGGTELLIDQRCDGKTAFVRHSVRGDHDITGNELQNLQNASFPTPFLRYKEAGSKVELVGKEKVGTRDVVVLQYTPKTGSSARLSFDAETWLLLRSVSKVEDPDSGGVFEQTIDLSNYREIDGVKTPFTVQRTNPVRTITIRFDKIEHNKPIDEVMFAKPVAK